MSIERKLETLEEKIGHANRKLEWLIAREEERDYRIDNPDHRTPSPLVLALREIAATIFDKLEGVYARLERLEENVMIDTAAIQAAVDRAAAGIDSVIALLDTTSAQVTALAAQVTDLTMRLAAAIAAGDPAAQQAIQDQLTLMAGKLNAEAAAMDAEKAKIAGATQAPPVV